MSGIVLGLAWSAAVALLVAVVIAVPQTVARVKVRRHRRRVQTAADDLMAVNDSLDLPYGLATCEAIWAASDGKEVQDA